MSNSLILIQNTHHNTTGIGTIIYANQNHQYILTSATLIEGFPNDIIIDTENKIKIIYQGSTHGLDMVILKVNIDRNSRLLAESSQKEMEVRGYLYQSSFKAITYQLKEKTYKITSNGEYLHGWKINPKQFSDGSPLICKESGKIVAMVSHKQQFAIAVENLKKLGREIPQNLIHSANYQPKIFISLSHTLPEMYIGKKMAQELSQRGYRVFLAITDITIGENWVERLSMELEECEYFILLLSKNSIESEMVAEELKSIKELQNEFSSPEILPIRINLPYAFNTQYEMLKQLDNINQLVWEKEEDTQTIIEMIDAVVSKKKTLQTYNQVTSSPKKELSSYSPMVTLEQPTGIVPFDSKSYIQREDDIKCYENLSERYSLIRIKAPNKYGKTSLLERLNLYAEKQGYSVVSLNFQRDFDKSQLSSLNELLSAICEIIGEELNIEVNINQGVLKRATSKLKATKYMNKILSLLDRPLVLSIDEADKLFEYKEVSDDFFSLIRAWNEKSKVNRNWENLKIILAHATEPLLGLTTLDQSPFDNVGLGIELSAFSTEEIQTLAQTHGIIFDPDELNRLFNFLGGHPLLTRRVLYTMAKEQKELDVIIKNTYCRKTIFFDHLRRYLWVIKKNRNLELFLQELLRGKTPYDDISSYILEATGLIKKQNNRIDFSCELYRVFFKEYLIKG